MPKGLLGTAQLTQFVAAIVLLFVGGWVKVAVDRWRRKQEKVDDGLQHIYEQLLALYQTHFWVVGAEMRGQKPRPERAEEFGRVRDHIVGQIRQTRGVPETERVLTALLSGKFKTERERHLELGRVLYRVGKRVNPSYARAMKRIGKENEREMMQDPEAFFQRMDRLEPRRCRSGP